jgi:hypothetical protein
MAVSVVQTGVGNDSGSTTAPIVFASTPTVGNLLLFWCSSTGSATVTPPTGLTAVASAEAGAYAFGRLYSRVVQPGDGVNWTFTTSTAQISAVGIELAGANTSSPFEGGTPTLTTPSSISTISITPATAGGCALTFCAPDGGTSASTLASSGTWTKVWAQGSADQWHPTGLGYSTNYTPGSSLDATWSIVNNDAGGVLALFVVVPATPTITTASSSYNTTGTSKTVAASWAAGDLVLVIGGVADSLASDGDSIATPTFSGGTFAAVDTDVTTGNHCWGSSWKCVPASAGSGNITATTTSGTYWGFSVIVIPASMHNNVGVHGNPNSTALTQSITVAQGSMLVECLFDWGAGAPAGHTYTPAGASAISGADGVTVSAQYTVYGGLWQNLSAGTASYGVSGITASGQPYTKVYLEVLAPGGAAPAAASGTGLIFPGFMRGAQYPGFVRQQSRYLPPMDDGASSSVVVIASVENITEAETSSVFADTQTADTGTVTEVSTLVVIVNPSTDSATEDETSALSVATSSADSITETEVSSRVATGSTTDAATETEISSNSATLSASTDAATEIEISSITVLFSSTDNALATESDLIVSVLASTETGTVTEASSSTGTYSSADAVTETETSTPAATLTSVDPVTESEVSNITVAPVATDTGTANEASTLTVTVSITDVATETETSSSTAIFSSSDTATETEVSAAGRLDNLASADTATATDSSTVSIIITSTDAATLTEGASSKSATVSTTDAATESAVSSASDSITSTESATETEVSSYTSRSIGWPNAATDATADVGVGDWSIGQVAIWPNTQANATADATVGSWATVRSPTWTNPPTDATADVTVGTWAASKTATWTSTQTSATADVTLSSWAAIRSPNWINTLANSNADILVGSWIARDYNPEDFIRYHLMTELAVGKALLVSVGFRDIRAGFQVRNLEAVMDYE